MQNVDDVIVAKKKLVHRDKIGSEELIISDRLCFIHLPKTGGTFVRKYLTENVPGQTLQRFTLALSGWKTKEIGKKQSIIGIVRNLIGTFPSFTIIEG